VEKANRNAVMDVAPRAALALRVGARGEHA
jgi:hypothetical protein